MAKIDSDVLVKMYGNLICPQPIRFQDTEFFGDDAKRVIEFDIYDGFAYCEDFEGRELFLTYPRIDFVNTCKEMAQSIREFMGLDDNEKINEVARLLGSNNLSDAACNNAKELISEAESIKEDFKVK